MLLIQDHEIVFPQASFITSKKQVTARPNYDPFQYLLNNTWVTDQPRFHVAISDDNNNWSLSLPWPSESNPHTVIWTIERTDGSIIFGTIPEGVAGPVSVYQLLNTYNWSIQTGPENVFTPASLSQNADFSTINLSALSNQIFVTPNGTLSWSPTLPRVITFPDVSGTVLTTGNLSAITGAIAINSLTVQTPNISTIGITVKGTLGQVADLQEWQDSTGAVKALINTQQLLGPSGTTTVPGIGFISDSTTGINNLSPGTMNLMVSGAQMFSVTSTGLTGQASGARFKASSDPISYTFRDNTGIGFDQWGNSHLQIYTASIVRMLVSNTGLVGIGTGGGATLPVAQLHIANSTASNIGTIIKGAPSQTADLQQWQDSTGAVLASIHGTNGVNTIFSLINNTGWTAKTAFNFGGPTTAHQWSLGNDNAGNNSQNFWLWDAAVGTFRLFIDSGGKLQVGGGIGGDTTPVANLDVRVGAANTIGTVIRGFASQVSDLQEWQDSTGAVLARVDSGGNFLLPTGNGVIQAGIWQSPIGGFIKQGSFSIQLSGSVQPLNGTGTNVPIIVQGGASQTADLQQWQNSTSTILAKVDNSGIIYTASGVNVGSLSRGQGYLNVTTSFPTSQAATFTAAPAQTEDITQWLSSTGTVLALVDHTGGFSGNWVYGSIVYTSFVKPPNGLGSTIALSNTGSAKIQTDTAYVVPLVVAGAASQTADLQQWQDSTGGTIFAKVTSRGDIHTNVIGAATTAPGLIQFDNAAAFRISDGFDGLQSASGHRTQLFGYWGLMLQGNIQNVLGAPTYVAGTADHFGVIIPTAWAGDVGLIVQGSPSQSADLQQWQDSTGAVLAKVDANGSFTNTNNSYVSCGYLVLENNVGILWNGSTISRSGANGAITVGMQNYTGASFIVQSGNAGSIPLITQGAASQSADLQQWQNSTGAVLAKVDAGGNLTCGTIATGSSSISTQNISASFIGCGELYVTSSSNAVALGVIGHSGQTADLQQWQDSTGAVLTSIDASGNLRTNNNIYGNYLQANQLFVYTSTATTLGLVIHGQASQTADLFQAQDSTNAVKARIDPSGAIAPQNGARITSGIGAPTTPGGINPTTGDFYLRTDGSTGTHIYFCSVGGATPTWVALV